MSNFIDRRQHGYQFVYKLVPSLLFQGDFARNLVAGHPEGWSQLQEWFASRKKDRHILVAIALVFGSIVCLLGEGSFRELGGLRPKPRTYMDFFAVIERILFFSLVNRMRTVPGIILCLGLLALPNTFAQENVVLAVTTWDTPFSSQLASAGVVPAQTVQVVDATFHLSNPYAIDDSRQIAVAWISVRDQRSVRALYRSNSQCCWRMVDAMTPSHIGKGFHEFDTNVPIDVTIALLRSATDVAKLSPWKLPEQSQMSQESLAQKMFELLTVNRDEGRKTGDVITVGNMYMSKEYASWIPMLPQPFSTVNGLIKTPTGSEVADPEKTLLPPEAQLPDFGTEQVSVKFKIPAYARFTRSEGELIGKVFPSRNGKIRYYFVEDSKKRVFLSCVENSDSPVCILGLRTQYLDVNGMDSPLLEYGFQIPESYGGTKQSRYQLNWNWVRALPIIRYYYSSTGKPVPDES
jgi:hypothetical protein